MVADARPAGFGASFRGSGFAGARCARRVQPDFSSRREGAGSLRIRLGHKGYVMVRSERVRSRPGGKGGGMSWYIRNKEPLEE